jgi:N-acetyl-1-D-myo-inositol-2-amino-2-deoxy-alpha-D-glucopyranoside deacetylase
MRDRGLLCVHAHPDDESIATGGVLARASDAGLPTAVVTCTGGEHGEINAAEVDPALSPAQLRQVRAGELADALGILRVAHGIMLGFVDSGMMGTHTNDAPESFWRASLDSAVGRLVEHLRTLRPAVVVTYDAYGLYGHPDHVQTHRVTVMAVHAAAHTRLYPQAGPPWRVPKAYFVTLPQSTAARVHGGLQALGLPSPFVGEGLVGTPEAHVTCAVDVRPWLGRKLAALRAHRSQVGPDSLFLNIPDEMTDLAFGTEWFERWRCDVDAPASETDLFAGL